MKFPVHFFEGTRKMRFEGLVRIIGLAVVLMLAGLLPGCSAIKLAYNQATDLAYWQLDGYFDFNGTQTLQIREEIAKVHLWHRQTQLPDYADTLKKWQDWMPADMDEAQACGMFDEMRGKLLALSGRGEAALAALAGTMAPEQLGHLKRKFSKLNAQYRSDFLDGAPQALIDKRVDKAISRAEMLYGTLEDKQLAVLRSRITQSVFNARLSLAEYQRRQQDALQTLTPLIATPSLPEQSRSAVRAYFERVLNSPDPVYRNYQQELTRDSCKTFAALHNSTSPPQRAKAVETLKNYERDFRTLAAQRL